MHSFFSHDLKGTSTEFWSEVSCVELGLRSSSAKPRSVICRLARGKKPGEGLTLDTDAGASSAGVGDADVVDGGVAEVDLGSSSGADSVGASAKVERDLRVRSRTAARTNAERVGLAVGEGSLGEAGALGRDAAETRQGCLAFELDGPLADAGDGGADVGDGALDHGGLSSLGTGKGCVDGDLNCRHDCLGLENLDGELDESKRAEDQLRLGGGDEEREREKEGLHFGELIVDVKSVR